MLLGMDTETMHIAPKPLRLAVARALVDGIAGRAGNVAAGADAGGRVGEATRIGKGDRAILDGARLVMLVEVTGPEAVVPSAAVDHAKRPPYERL